MKYIKTFDQFLLENQKYFQGLGKSTAAKKRQQMRAQAQMDDDDPDAYQPMPGDSKGKKNLKTSIHTKNYHRKFSENENADSDLIESETGSTDRGPIHSPEIERALKKKSQATGVPIGILRAVMRRGMAAWKSGHRPGATQQQWGYARVNSFLTKGKGTWSGADQDLAREVRDGGWDQKL